MTGPTISTATASPPHPTLRWPRGLLVLLALVATACREASVLAPQPEAEPTEPQRTFGTAGFESATAATVRGSAVYVVGTTSGSLDGPQLGGTDVFIRKYHPEGEVLWRDQFGTNLSDQATGVAADNSSNVLVVGWTNGSLAGSRGDYDAFVRKYDASGKLLWTRQFGTPLHDEATSVSADGNGNVYVAGRTYGALQGAAQGVDDAFVRKYSPTGNEVWTRQFGTSASEMGLGVATDPTGNLFVVGVTAGGLQGPNAGDYDAFVRKYSPDGTVSWTRQFGTAGTDYAYAVAVDGTGAAIAAGLTYGNLQGTNAGGSDAYARKYSPTGAVLATRQFGTDQFDLAQAAAVDASNNFYVSGYTTGSLSGSSAGGFDAFVRKFNGSNTAAWTTQFGTSGSDQAFAVAAGSSSAVFVAGSTTGTLVGSNSGGYDAFLRRLNSSGQSVWTDQ